MSAFVWNAFQRLIEVLSQFQLSLRSQIYAALAYALANPNEIEESLREEDDMAGQLSPEGLTTITNCAMLQP